MVTDGDMSAAAALTAAYMETLRENSRVSRAAALLVKAEDENDAAVVQKAEADRKEKEESAFNSLNATHDEEMVKTFEVFLSEVVDARLRLEHHLTKNTFRSVFGRKEGRDIPINTNAPELFE